LSTESLVTLRSAKSFGKSKSNFFLRFSFSVNDCNSSKACKKLGMEPYQWSIFLIVSIVNIALLSFFSCEIGKVLVTLSGC